MRTLDKNSFYSFVVSALINETNKDQEAIIGEYQNHGMSFDMFFPFGSKYLDYPGKRPLIVDISYSFKIESFINTTNQIKKLDINAFYVLITYTNLKEYNTRHIPGTRVLGRDFVEELIGRNQDAYLSAILGNPNTTLNVGREEAEESYREDKPGLYISNNNEKLYLSEDDPNKLNELFKNEFKTYLKGSNNDKTNCAVIIGNGVSIPFGSDSWSDMIDNLSKYLEPFFVESSNNIKNALSNSSFAISSFTKNLLVRNGLSSKYIDALHYCIYRKYNNLMHESPSLIKAIALAKEKYPLLPLLTYNYDTFVERQYEFETKKVLMYFNQDPFRRDAKISYKNNVIHLHGYLSYTHKKYSGLILTDEEYFKAYLNNPRSWVFQTQIDALTNYKCLYVGSSMSDLFQMSVINKARKHKSDEKWCCFALMCFANLSLKEKMELIKYYLEKGIKVIFVETFEDLPDQLAGLFSINMKGI